MNTATFSESIEELFAGNEFVTFWDELDDIGVGTIAFDLEETPAEDPESVMGKLLSRGLASAYTKQTDLFSKGVRKKRDWPGMVFKVGSELWLFVTHPVNEEDARAMLVALRHVKKHVKKIVGELE